MSDIDKISEAIARHAYGDTIDDAGKIVVVSHLKHTADVLRTTCPDDKNLIAAGWLHDIIEDNILTEPELIFLLEEQLAEGIRDVINLIWEVTHEGNKSDGYYFPRLISQRGIMLKFADRLSNLTRMEAWDIARREHYLKKSKFWKSMEGENKYPAPSITVDGILYDHAKHAVLLVRRKNDPHKNKYALPGGFLNYSERLRYAIVREFREETGLDVLPGQIISLRDKPNRDPRCRVISVVFEVFYKGGEIKAGDDASAVEWHPIAALPSLAFDHAEIIRTFICTHQHPDPEY